MALVYCPECGTQVSEHAKQCTKCAYPISKIRLEKDVSQPISLIQKKEENTGLVIAGYIVAFLALFIYPVVLLIAGVVIGIVTITKGRTGHGVAHIFLSLLFGILGAVFGAIFWLLN